jgi:hypothetical protein
MCSSSHRASAQTFCGSIVKSSSDEESDGETDFFMATAGMVNKELLLPPHRGGSSKKQEANVDRDLEDGHVRLYKDYFDTIWLIRWTKRRHFLAAIGCPEKCLWSFSMV